MINLLTNSWEEPEGIYGFAIRMRYFLEDLIQRLYIYDAVRIMPMKLSKGSLIMVL